MRFQIRFHNSSAPSLILMAALLAPFAQDQVRDPFGAPAAGALPSDAIIPMLGLLCPNHVMVDRKGAGPASYGCDACPEGNHEKGGSVVWSVDRAIYGHYYSKDFEDALLVMSGCEPHASLWGGTAAFTRIAGIWRKLWYKPGLITDRCRKVTRRDERDVLVCALDDRHYNGTEWSLSTVDIAAETPVTILLGLLDSTGACTPPMAQKASVASIEYRDLNGDGLGDIRVTVQYGRRALSRAFLDKYGCDAVPKVPARSYVIDFLFDGQVFRVAPASVANKALVERY